MGCGGRLLLLHHEKSSSIMTEMAMAAPIREKFSSQAAPEVLAALRQIAESQGRQFQAVLDAAPPGADLPGLDADV
jgi:hypothetical protein